MALVQSRSYARAKQGMQAAGYGCVPFREWPGSHVCLVWHGLLAADPLAVLEACYSEAHVFISDVPARLSAVWVRYVEFGHVSPHSLSAVFRLRTAPHCHVEPEPVFTCHFCWRPCVSWGPHLWYECPCAVWGASCAFAFALTLLPCDGRVWHSPYQCTVYRGDSAVAWALAHESAFPGLVHYTPCPDVYVTWSGLVHSPRGPKVVLAAQRDLTMDSYLGALGTWLVLPARLRLLDMTPPDRGWPHQWAAVVLAASLVHCLGRPPGAVSNLA